MELMLIFDFELQAAINQVKLRRPEASFLAAKRGRSSADMEQILDMVCNSSTYVHASLIALESEWCVIC